MRNIFLFIVFISLTFLIFGCYQKKVKLKITDFTKVYNDTLIPKKNASYASAILQVRGYANDTVMLSFYGIEKKIKGNIDIKLNSDYYGSIDVYFKFDPMNAREGNLEIQYGIY